MARFVVIVERAGSNLSAYLPDVPGCVATGATRDEALENIRIAVEMHIEGLREDGQLIHEPSTMAAYVEVVT